MTKALAIAIQQEFNYIDQTVQNCGNCVSFATVDGDEDCTQGVNAVSVCVLFGDKMGPMPVSRNGKCNLWSGTIKK